MTGEAAPRRERPYRDDDDDALELPASGLDPYAGADAWNPNALPTRKTTR